MVNRILVVGGGLSGTCIAYNLVKKGLNVTLIDSGVNRSSKVAAGMINPLVFRRMTKSWRVDEFMPYLHSFYTELEQATNRSFFHEIEIRRVFSSQQEREFWVSKQLREEFRAYMHTITDKDDDYNQVINPYGTGRVKKASYIDTGVFLDSMRSYLSQHASIIEAVFDYGKLGKTEYAGERFDHVVFCEGYQGVHNPFFNYLPLNQTQGETLLIRSETLPQDHSVNRKCFVLPLGNGTFKIGSTYKWHTPDPSPTVEGRETLLANLSYLTSEKVAVLSHEGGVRPTTEDRRPLIGTHSEFINYHIFNGLGTKGYMLAPLLAKEFVEYLINGEELNSEVNISRFNRKN